MNVPADPIRALLRSGRRRPLFEPGPGTVRTDHDAEAIRRILPHRDPFALVDGIDHVDLEQAAIEGHRRVAPDDPVLRGHFPTDPVYPGVLLLEAAGQLGLCLQYFLGRGSPDIPPDARPRSLRLVKIEQASFLGGVGPDQRLRIQCRCVDEGDYLARCAGQVLVGEEVKALALFEVMYLDTASPVS